MKAAFPPSFTAQSWPPSPLSLVTMFAVGLWDRAQTTVKYLPVWFFGGLGFLYLSMDEALELHERGSRLVFEYLGIQDRIAHYQLTPALWEAVFAPVFVAIGLLILWVLFQERHRLPVAFRLGLAALGFWALALITEFFEMTYFIHSGFWFWRGHMGGRDLGDYSVYPLSGGLGADHPPDFESGQKGRHRRGALNSKGARCWAVTLRD